MPQLKGQLQPVFVRRQKADREHLAGTPFISLHFFPTLPVFPLYLSDHYFNTSLVRDSHTGDYFVCVF